MTIPENYKLGTLYYNVTRGADMGSGTHISPVDVVATYKIICYRTFWKKQSRHIKGFILSETGIILVPRRMRNYDSYME